VLVAASDARGHARGETVDGTAAILDDTARVESLLASKYGVVYRLVRAFNALVRAIRRRPPEPSVTLAITTR
jgi:hypothetical protein